MLVLACRYRREELIEGVSLGQWAEGDVVEAAGRLFQSLTEWAGLCLHPDSRQGAERVMEVILTNLS